MIHHIYSDMPTFKELYFRPGLNILLAEKSPGATERQTRNGAGKSSLTELIHFLLGASDAKSLFTGKSLRQYTFSMSFNIASGRSIVSRTGRAFNRITLDEAEIENWETDTQLYNLFGTLQLTNTQWKSKLGRLTFDLHENEDEGRTNKFSPSFRSLFSYFVRRQSDGGFFTPIRHSNMQQIWDWQVSISYLLGLDWTIPQQWQYVREREKSIRELRKAANDGLFGNFIGTTAELRTMLTLAENKVRELRENIHSFNLLPEYHNLEQEADQLTRELSVLANENTLDRSLIKDLQESLDSETDPTTKDLERLYEEAGVLLSDAVVRRFAEVKVFHDSIIANRRSYLGSELAAARERIRVREERIPDASRRVAQIMAILQSHGALDQLTKLQAEISQQEAKTEVIRHRYAAAEQLESLKSELDFERSQLELRLRRDYHEQNKLLQDAILAFGKISSALYEEAGNFTIDATSNGPRFDVTIRGEKSKGISNMQIFCFDMMLMRLCAERNIGPGFLVHDSHIFDGVDERQIATALQIGANTARELNFQYIVTMNSDAIPRNFPINDYVLPVRLTDATEDGGLFGIRF